MGKKEKEQGGDGDSDGGFWFCCPSKKDKAEKSNAGNVQGGQPDVQIPVPPPKEHVFECVRPCSEMVVGVPTETHPNEKRVAVAPPNIEALIKKGYRVGIQEGAGAGAEFLDSMYSDKGAEIVSKEQAFSSDIVMKVRAPTMEEVDLLKEGAILISFIWPGQNKELVDKLASRKVTVLGMDCIPRLSRSQVFDALSSMAGIAGYKAVVEAASSFGRYFTGTMTAAGSVPPAHVLVIGAGVAGLQAIATAKAMGAVVYAYDSREVVKSQVEAMNAKFLMVATKGDGDGGGGYAKEQSADDQKLVEQLYHKWIPKMDIVITTALLPGKPAPLLVTKAMLDAMKPGSVTVDLAAEQGGNVETTKKDEKYVYNNRITCIGYTDLPSRLATQASTMYSNNIAKFLLYCGPKAGQKDKDGNVLAERFGIDMDDEVVRKALVVLNGEWTWEKPSPPKPTEAKATESPVQEVKEPSQLLKQTQAVVVTTLGLGALVGIGIAVPASWVGNVTTFALATIVGYNTVQSVEPSLHSPLMSVTNAISGTVIVAALLVNEGTGTPSVEESLTALAVFFSSFNIFAGFRLTQRTLANFTSKDKAQNQHEHNWMWFIPTALFGGGFGVARILGGYQALDSIGFLVSSSMCIFSIADLSSQRTARRGNVLGMCGVFLGTAVTFISMYGKMSALKYAYNGGIILLGGSLGFYVGSVVNGQELPQMTAAFHSVVGLAAVLVSFAEFLVDVNKFQTDPIGTIQKISIYLGAIIGGVTFTGSIVAALKLHGLKNQKALSLPGRDFLNFTMGVSIATCMGFYMYYTDLTSGLITLGAGTAVSLLLGWHMTDSIGGGDMPVVITILNSYSGWALVAEGFVLSNNMLIIVGSLIGSSGALLTWIMCKNMNRSIFQVLLGGFGSSKIKAKEVVGTAVACTMDEVQQDIDDAETIIIVPGYGLVQAHAHFAVSQLTAILNDMGKKVRYAIHPVAGRMPGQLNVLLAEAAVPYEAMFEMEDINMDFPKTDLVIVIGANDTINSGAEDDPGSPIAGMPVLQVWKAKKVIILKRSMSQGYAGCGNPVFLKENTRMLFGDAQKSCLELLSRYQGN